MSKPAKDAIILVAPDGVITFWNQQAESLFGHLADDVVGRSLDVIIPEDFKAQHWAAFNRVVESGHMKLDRAALNIPVQHKDGRIIPFPGRFVFLQGPRNTVAGFAAIYSTPSGEEELFGEVLPLP